MEEKARLEIFTEPLITARSPYPKESINTLDCLPSRVILRHHNRNDQHEPQILYNRLNNQPARGRDAESQNERFIYNYVVRQYQINTETKKLSANTETHTSTERERERERKPHTRIKFYPLV